MNSKYYLQEQGQKIPKGFQIYDDRIEVAGIPYRKDVAAKFVNQTGQWLEFESEPLNRYDSNAIKVLGCYHQNNEIQKLHVGYVPADIAKQITNFSVDECKASLLKTNISVSGYVEILFQVLGPKGKIKEYQQLSINKPEENDIICERLSMDALNLITNKPKSWEYRLFFQIWIDEVNFLQEKIQKYNNPFKDDQVEFNCENFISWGRSQLNKIDKYIKHANKLINIEADNAFGLPGKAGDGRSITLVAKDMAKLLEKLLDWSMHIRSFKTEEPFTRALNAMSRLPGSAIATLIEFPFSALDKIEKALAVASPDNRQQVDLAIDFTISNLDEFDSAFDDVYKYYEI